MEVICLNTLVEPNDTAYYVVLAESVILRKRGDIIFRCSNILNMMCGDVEKCDRIYLFKENKVVKVYKPEE